MHECWIEKTWLPPVVLLLRPPVRALIIWLEGFPSPDELGFGRNAERIHTQRAAGGSVDVCTSASLANQASAAAYRLCVGNLVE